MIKREIIQLDSDGSGDATDYSNPVLGRLLAFSYNKGSLADGVDLTITCEGPISQSILSLTNANADATYYPRTPSQDTAAADVTYDGTNEIYEPFFLDGKIKVVTADGGGSKSGQLIAYIKD